MATFMGRPEDWIDRRAEEWVRAGLVTTDEAEAIVRYEHRPTERVERLSIGAEVASYLGSVLALMGGAFVVARSWDRMPFAGRAGLAVAIAFVGLAAGTWLVRIAEAGTVRLGTFLWAVGTGGIAMLVVVTGDRVLDDPGWVLVATGAAVLVLGVGLWRNLERPLQFLTAGVGAVLVLAGIGELVEIPILVGSIVLMAVGGVLALGAGLGWLVPRDLVTAAGAASAFIGAMSLSEIDERVGPFVALAVAALLVAHALVARRTPLLVIGVIGTLIATQAVLMTTFSGALASMIVSLIGLAVVVGAVLHSLHPNHHRNDHPTHAG